MRVETNGIEQEKCFEGRQLTGLLSGRRFHLLAKIWMKGATESSYFHRHSIPI